MACCWSSPGGSPTSSESLMVFCRQPKSFPPCIHNLQHQISQFFTFGKPHYKPLARSKGTQPHRCHCDSMNQFASICWYRYIDILMYWYADIYWYIDLCWHILICWHIDIYIYILIYWYFDILTDVYIYVCIDNYTDILTNLYIDMLAYIDMLTYTHIYILMYWCIAVNIYIHISIYIYVHMPTYQYVYGLLQSWSAKRTKLEARCNSCFMEAHSHHALGPASLQIGTQTGTTKQYIYICTCISISL